MKPVSATLLATAIVLALVITTPYAWAQSDGIAEQFRKVTPEEEKNLRALLAEPVPEGASFEQLRAHFRAKIVAAGRLAEPGVRESVLRETVKWLPDAARKNDLARELLARGEIEEGNLLMQEAVAGADPFIGLYLRANIACDLVDQNKTGVARKTIEENLLKIASMQSQARQTVQRMEAERAKYRNFSCLSMLEDSLGKYPASVSAAIQSEKFAREALPLGLRYGSLTTRQNVQRDLANSLGRKVTALRGAGKYGEAEIALTEYIRTSKELELPANSLSQIYREAAAVRFSQREFAQAEALGRKADEVLSKLGYSRLEGGRPRLADDLSATMAAQKKWSEALALYEQLDALAGDDAKSKTPISFNFGRALALLGNARYPQSAELFRLHALNSEKSYGDGHFFTAQSRGLQGVALWRTGSAENRAQALPLLKGAVRAYMSPANAEFLENTGYRKERRDEIFSTYLEAVATTQGENPIDAMGPADWARTGSVQDALNDAAVRAAANSSALADTVRLEQDAKNEIAGLRRYLSGESGSSASQLPTIAAQMRARIAVLEAERLKYQVEIKAKFPDYERLVRPAMPGAQDIARQLDASQALLLILPTAEAVYAWAVARDRPAAFVRVGIPQAEIDQAVKRLRANLDFASFRGAPSRFDNAAAFSLYQRLIAPLNATLEGKSQWIVAAGGSLSQLPFAVLQTQASTDSGPAAPWLIKTASLAQVPSLSAWLALKDIAKKSPATQAFIGWGDPAFSSTSAPALVRNDSAARKVLLARGTRFDDITEEKVATRTSAPSALRYADIPPLPETRDELIAIATALRANPQSDVILGSQATRESVLASNKNGSLMNRRVVAFATHGLMAGDLPNLTQPALALAVNPSSNAADGATPLAPLLMLEDVLSLKLNADWVVLSACNTAAADGRAEEALSGLARGFFYAGARSLLVTHWAVDSAAATALTTATFAHYTSNPQSPKAESLRQAMLGVMSSPAFPHPAYWAPYALVGDGGR